MSKYEKLLLQILRGASDSNIEFEELCRLLKRLGFEERVRGSHHNFRKSSIEEKINLQRMIISPNRIRFGRCALSL